MDHSKKFHQRFYLEKTNDTNAMWKTIRSCIPKKSVSRRVYSNDDKTVANRFNQFFTSIGETTNKKIKLFANECSYAPVQPTYSPELPIAEQYYSQLLEFIVPMLKGLCCHQPEIKHPELTSYQLMSSKTLHLLSLPPLLVLLLLRLPLALLLETGKLLKCHQF